MAVRTSWTAGDVLTAADLTDTFADKANLSAVKIKQVVTGSYSTSVTVASTTFTDTGLSASITPTSASSTVLVVAFQQYELGRLSVAENGHALRLLRGSTAVFSPDPTFLESGYLYLGSSVAMGLGGRASIMYLDSPATTSATTYKLQGRAFTAANSGNVVYQRGSSTSNILLLEIAS